MVSLCECLNANCTGRKMDSPMGQLHVSINDNEVTEI